MPIAPPTPWQLALLALSLLWAMASPAELYAEDSFGPLLSLGEAPAGPAEFAQIVPPLTVEFLQGEKKLTVPAQQLVRWGTLGELRGREALVLRDGSLLTGSLARVDGSGIAWEHPVFDPVAIPRQALAGVVLQRPADPLAYDRLLLRLQREAFPADTLLLVNGDTLTGTLTEPPAEAEATGLTQVSISVAGAVTTLALEHVTAIAFASETQQQPIAPRLLVGLRQGDLLYLSALESTPRSVSLQLAAGLQLATDPAFLWGDVTFLQGKSPQVVSLTDLPPLSYRHLPLLGWELPLALNSNVLGGRLRSGGSLHPAGLGMPGSSRVAFQLEGNFSEFRAAAALDAAAGHRGSVVFRLYRRVGSGPLELVFESETLRGGEPPVPIRADIAGATLLVLLVDAADRGDELDYANWIAPRLLK